MGREIRRVIPNWEHPTKTEWDFRAGQSVERYQPMYDHSVEEYEKWVSSEFKEKIANPENADWLDPNSAYASFCQWHGTPPEPDYYRPKWKEEDMTWIQVYETVSEGTPVSPPFETEDELIDYLVENGDFWDQQRRKDGRDSFMPCDPWSREAAEKFVKGTGWAPSLVVNEKTGFVGSGVEAIAAYEM